MFVCVHLVSCLTTRTCGAGALGSAPRLAPGSLMCQTSLLSYTVFVVLTQPEGMQAASLTGPLCSLVSSIYKVLDIL